MNLSRKNHFVAHIRGECQREAQDSLAVVDGPSENVRRKDYRGQSEHQARGESNLE